MNCNPFLRFHLRPMTGRGALSQYVVRPFSDHHVSTGQSTQPTPASAEIDHDDAVHDALWLSRAAFREDCKTGKQTLSKLC
jgi:hypothetical protein